ATLSVAGVKGELPSLEALRAPVNAPSMPEARSETDPHAAAKAKAIADMRAEAEAANNPANYPYGSAEKPVQVEPQTAGLQQQETTARVAGQPSGVIYDESGNAYTINEAGQPEQLTPQLTS